MRITFPFYFQFKNLRATACVVLILLAGLLTTAPAQGQTRQKPADETVTTTRILFLFDASQSMYGRWQSGIKIDVAKKMLSELLDSLKKAENVELALRVYGHLKKYPPQDCDDTRLEVPFGKANHDQIKRVLNNLTPKGTTPIASSLEASGGDFPATPARNIIILITDGVEECNGDPCAVSQALQKRGIILKPFVIGMGLDESYMRTFECVGNYYDATNETTFKTVLNIVISQALNSTTAQVNLLDANNNPTETNVNMTFYDSFSKNIRYNFIHTMNHRGNPDTLKIDPLSTYDITVHTIPPVSASGVKLTPGKHTIIPIDASQGYLKLVFDGISDYRKLQCIVRRSTDMNTLYVQEFNNTNKYISGKYDLEVLSLPRIHIRDVEVSQSKTTTVQIPQPGMVTFLTNSAGYGSVLLEEDNKLALVVNLNETLTKETVVLQPGNYRVEYRPRNSKDSVYTIEKKFRIVSGSSIVVNIN